MNEFSVRALEVHSGYVWNYDWVRKAMDFASAQGMTSISLHRNDIVDLIVYPSKLFGGNRKYNNIFERYQDIHRSLYKYTPTRRSGPYQRRDYLRRILDLAGRQGLDVYFENKELSFHEIFLELNPQLTKNGVLCPNEPFWFDFIDVKYRELFEDLPGIKGIITAPGTGESRLSIAANRCSCDLCQGVTPAKWYSRLIGAMHRPIAEAGKRLIVRDFVFDKAAQNDLVEAIEHLPEDIVMSFKNTPHDYYPTFPDNARIGDVGTRPQWVEFDCMGQYFGWGVAPAIMIEDIRKRLAVADAAGVEGVIFRTDWESLDGHSAFHTPNIINAYAGAALSRRRDVEPAAIMKAWLAGQGMLEAEASSAEADEAAAWAWKVFAPSWDAVRQSLYTNECVFSDSSTYPVSLAHAWWLAEEKNSLKDWAPEKSDALISTPENTRQLLAEKDNAVAVADEMVAAALQKPAGISTGAHRDIVDRLKISRMYIGGYREIGHALVLTRYLLDRPGDRSEFAGEVRVRLSIALQALISCAEEFAAFAEKTDHRYTTYVLLGHERLRALHADLTRQLGEAAVSLAA